MNLTVAFGVQRLVALGDLIVGRVFQIAVASHLVPIIAQKIGEMIKRAFPRGAVFAIFQKSLFNVRAGFDLARPQMSHRAVERILVAFESFFVAFKGLRRCLFEF